MFKLVSVFVALSATEGAGPRSCTASATVSSHLIQAGFLAFDKYVMVRARFGDDAYLAEGLQCLEGSPRGKVPVGITWRVMEPLNVSVVNESPCLSATVFNPQGGSGLSKPIDPRMRSVQTEKCRKESYERNPWLCEAGDWSGKFGTLDLGMGEILKELRGARSLAAAETWADLHLSQLSEEVLRAAPERVMLEVYPMRPREEVRVHQDDLPIPPCQLEGKVLGLFCADGRLAGCAKFEPVIPTSYGRAGAMEAAIRYITTQPHAPPCPLVFNGPTTTAKPSTEQSPAESWTDRITKELGKVPDYVSSWWDDVRKKSKDAWSQMN